MRKLILTMCILSIAMLCFAQWQINEGFEAVTLPTGWTVYDDGDGMMWRSINNVSHAHSGSRAAFVDNYLPNQNSDWLITPALNIIQGDSLYFYTRSWVSTENLEVYVSTTGTGINNFNQQLVNLQNIGVAYQSVQLDLSAYTGQSIYIGFHWQCSNYGILVDDLKVGHPQIIQPVLNLPESFTFIQGESLSQDFTPYITSTNINTAALSVTGNNHVEVVITNHEVTFSSPAWNGNETLTFTLTDNSSGLQTTDSALLIVTPVPAVDLALTRIITPRLIEYVSHQTHPTVQIQNLGDNTFEPPVEVNCIVTDAQDVEVYNQNATLTQSLASDSTALIVFTQNWIPGTAGSYQVHYNLITMDENPVNNSITETCEVVIREMTGGPDGFGYRWIDSNADGGPAYIWNDISQTGQSAVMYGVNAFSGDDNFSEPVDLGFLFPFYGTVYSHCYIDINGELLLAENPWYEPYPGEGWGNDGNMFNYMYPVPGYTQMPAMIAAYWDDLQADPGAGDIFFQSFGNEPNRYFVIQWNNLRYHAGTGANTLLKFQAVLHQNGEIYFYYHTTQTGQSGSTVPHNNGRSATVAIQNAAANLGLCYLREIVTDNTYLGVEPAGNLLHDGLAIHFYSGADTQAPVITHTQPGNTFELTPVLQAHIIDMSNITSAVLHYNYDGNWQVLNATGPVNGDYTYTLPQLPQGCTLQYYFTATDANTNSAALPATAPDSVFSFNVLPGAQAELLLLYPGTQDYNRMELTEYRSLLDAQGVDYDYYNWQEFTSYQIPQSYDTILCFASNGLSGTASQTLSQQLMLYLDSGTAIAPKHLFFASDGWAFGQGGLPNSSPEKKLMNAYFRNYYVPTGTGGGTNGLSGPDFIGFEDGTLLITDASPVGDPGGLFSVYANSPDCIFAYDECPSWYADEVQFPEIGAQNALAFEDGPINGQAYLYHGVCATIADLGFYKAFYISFDLSQLSVPAERTLFMHDLLEWFGENTNAEDNQIPEPQVVSLAQNFPNPFNPETKISFAIRSATQTQIEIYNTKGQRVRSLYSGEMASGTHSLVWDGLDDAGKPVASGIYYCRLQNDGIIKTRKMLLIK